jgi:hypothetical protein
MTQRPPQSAPQITQAMIDLCDDLAWSRTVALFKEALT